MSTVYQIIHTRVGPEGLEAMLACTTSGEKPFSYVTQRVKSQVKTLYVCIKKNGMCMGEKKVGRRWKNGGFKYPGMAPILCPPLCILHSSSPFTS